MKRFCLVLLLVMVPTVIFATTQVMTSVQKRDEICEQLLEEGLPETVAVGPHVKLGKISKWVIDNTNKPDGWSLTGYASLKVDKQGSLSRWKVGIINGELDWAIYEDINSYPDYQKLDEWNQRKNNEIVFGIFFCKEF